MGHRKIVPGVSYSREELVNLMSQAEADDLKMRGYYLRFDSTSRRYTVVPHAERAGTIGTSEGMFDPVPPIRKRSRIERVDSLMLKWIEDCKRAGTVPGLSDAKITEIVGEAWKAGRTEVTGEMVRKVAQHFLDDAERKHEAKLDRQITRHED